MILIKSKDFSMEQVKTTSCFDLSILTTVNEGKSNERMELKLWGYGMTIESCVKTIITHRLAQLDKTFKLEEYLNYYRAFINAFIESVETEIVTKKEPMEVNVEEEEGE